MWKNMIFFLMVLLSSCSINQAAINDSSVLLNSPMIKPDYFKEKFKIESIIPIETTDSFLISDIRKIVRLKDDILLLSNNQTVSLIDAHTGRLKTNIRRYGNGPGESNHIIDIAFDETSNYILIYNDYNKLVVLDLRGNFLSEVKLDAMYENMTCSQGEVVFYNKVEGYSCFPYTFKIYTLKDKTWRDIDNDVKIEFPIRSKGRQMVRSKQIWFNAPLDYKMYCVEENDLIAHYQLDFPTSKLGEDLIEKSISNPVEFLMKISKEEIVYSINSVRETRKHLIFRSNQADLFFLNKDDNTLYKDNFLFPIMLCITPTEYFPHDGDDNCVLFVVPAEMWRKQSELSSLSIEMKMKVDKLHISEDDNPILVFFEEVD